MQKSTNKVLLILPFLLIFAEFCFGQIISYPFKNGEKASYGAYYNWNFIWIQSGKVDFKADSIQLKKQNVWHIKAVGSTLKAYDFFYTVRDTFETFNRVETFQPIVARRVMNHAKSHSNHQYAFNYEKNEIAVKIQYDAKPLYQSFLPVQEKTYDLLSTAYYFRSFDFNQLIIGQKVPYRMLIDKTVDELYFRYLGKENIKTRTGKEFRCHKVSIYLLEGDFFPEGEYMKVWFTDDQNHLPIQVETEIMVGTVKALLLDTHNLKYPLTSQIQ